MFKPKTTIAGRLVNSSGGAISPLNGVRKQQKTPISGRLENSSGGAIQTHDLRVMSNAPESVPFVRGVLQIT